MDRQQAILFRQHALAAIRELSSALMLIHDPLQRSGNAHIRRSVGDIVARIDGLMADAVYAPFPDLDDLKE